MIMIRKSRPEDGPHVVDVWRRSVEATHDFLLPGDLEVIDAQVRGFLPQMPLWIAVDGSDRPIGFMALEDADMAALFIDPDHRGTGIGRALVEHALTLQSTLTSAVNEQNTQAIGFYTRMGFRQISRSPTDDYGRPYPLIRLRLDPQGLREDHATRDLPRTRLGEEAKADVTIEPFNGDRATLRTLFELADDSPDEVARYIHLGDILVARAGATVIGHLQLVPTDDHAVVELKSMAVGAAHQNAGVGRALVAAGIAASTRQGCNRMTVSTAAADIGNLRFYQRQGFRMAQIIRDAFGPAQGYPADFTIEGIPLRDKVIFDRALTTSD